MKCFLLNKKIGVWGFPQVNIKFKKVCTHGFEFLFFCKCVHTCYARKSKALYFKGYSLLLVFLVLLNNRKGFDMTKINRTRSENVHFMATLEEKNLLLQNAKQAGYKTLGSYLLKMGSSGYVVNIDFSDIKSTLGDIGSIRREMNKIGNNINQVAKHANQSDEIDVMDFYILEQEMKKLKDQVEKFEKEIVMTFNQKIKEITKGD